MEIILHYDDCKNKQIIIGYCLLKSEQVLTQNVHEGKSQYKEDHAELNFPSEIKSY